MDEIIDLGLIDFRSALEAQRKLHERVCTAGIASATIVCRHHPVITMGRRTQERHILADPLVLKNSGIEVVRTDRGGDVTYHGPGQLVVYPVCDLRRLGKDIRRFLRLLEKTAAAVLEDFNIAPTLRDGSTGVWVNDRKIASVGIGVRRWTSYHGLALNIGQDDCRNFKLIRPCGMDIGMTSMEEELRRPLAWEQVRDTWIRRFAYA